MGLETYKKASTFVPFGTAEDSDGMTVYALDLNDVGSLISDHLGEIANALEIYEDLKANINQTGTLDRFVITVIRVLPDLAAEIIATAAGTPELSDKARDLAFGIQLRALSEISRITIEDAGGIKNLFAALPSVVAGLQMPRMQTPLTTQAN